MMASEWIDITVPIRNNMPYWPDNPPPRVEWMMDLERGDEATVSTLTVGSHTGTHMDAPLHFFAGGQGLEDMPLTTGRYELICLPLKFDHSDGATARAVVRPRFGEERQP